MRRRAAQRPFGRGCQARRPSGRPSQRDHGLSGGSADSDPRPRRGRRRTRPSSERTADAPPPPPRLVAARLEAGCQRPGPCLAAAGDGCGLALGGRPSAFAAHLFVRVPPGSAGSRVVAGPRPAAPTPGEFSDPQPATRDPEPPGPARPGHLSDARPGTFVWIGILENYFWLSCRALIH